MLLLRSAILALCVITSAQAATNPTIDKINISTVFGYGDSHTPSTTFPDYDRFGILGAALSYQLSDGQVRQSGAGWIPYSNGHLSAVTVQGSSISYEFDRVYNWAKGEGTLFYSVGQVWCSSCNEPNVGLWTEGQFAPVSPIVIKAELGSKTATLTGTAMIVSNAPGLWGNYLEDFVSFSSPVGSIVNYSATYVLTDGSVWDAGVFDRRFNYNVTGAIFLSPVPEPSTGALIALGLASGLLAARGRARTRKAEPALTAGC